MVAYDRRVSFEFVILIQIFDIGNKAAGFHRKETELCCLVVTLESKIIFYTSVSSPQCFMTFNSFLGKNE